MALHVKSSGIQNISDIISFVSSPCVVLIFDNTLQWRHNDSDGVTGEFSAQRASNVENGSIWWHHYEMIRDNKAMSINAK